MALPAVVIVLACALGGISLAGEQLRLQGAAFEAARLLGRGDPGALQRVRAVDPDSTLVMRRSGDAICADVIARASLGVLSGIILSASACALDDGRS